MNMQQNDVFEYISDDQDEIKTDLDHISEQWGDIRITMVEKAPFFYVGDINGNMALVHQIAHNKTDIVGEIKEENFKLHFSLTLKEAVEKGFVDNEMLGYSPEKVEEYLKGAQQEFDRLNFQ